MSATKFTLSQTPTKILDGTKAAYIQEVSGSGTRFTLSPTSPDTSSVPFCTIIKNDLSVSSGFKIAYYLVLIRAQQLCIAWLELKTRMLYVIQQCLHIAR